eukprot:scaffold299975_cov13-Tisochrysis_lutea.AAC.1
MNILPKISGAADVSLHGKHVHPAPTATHCLFKNRQQKNRRDLGICSPGISILHPFNKRQHACKNTV